MKDKKSIKKINTTCNETMKLFTMLSGYILLVLLLFSVFQIVKSINLVIVEILAIIIPIIIYLLKNDKLSKVKIRTITFYLLIVLILPFLYNKTYDFTQDGNSYHKTAIAFIKNGWNPLYESTKDFQKNNNSVIKIAEDSNVDLWVEHYPKGTWIIAATIYSMTNNIESGKCITLILLIMLFLLSYSIIKPLIDKKWAITISLLLAINPIVLVQLFTYYVDGIIGICFAIELLLLSMITVDKKISSGMIINLIAICCLFVNIKFTGLLCSGLIAAVYYFYWIIFSKKKRYQVFKKMTLIFSVAFVLAIFIVGSNYYVKNTLDHHNPLYPLFGNGKVDIVTTMQPKSFAKKNKFEKYIISTFSKTENVIYSEDPTIKLPFKVYRSEIDAMLIPDTRMAGFGPFTGLITIITVVLLIVVSVLFYKYEKNNFKYLLLSIISILLSTILVGESWWARYVPQLYLIPIGIVALLVYLKKYCNKKIIASIIAVFILIIVLNASVCFYALTREINDFIKVNKDLMSLRKEENLKLRLGGESDDLYGYFYTLNDNNIKYEIKPEIEEKNMRYVYLWRIGVEIDE